jgi:hypothetical protein
MPSLTFDTSAMIALENHRKNISEVVRHARAKRATILLPANVLAEWWRGGRRHAEVLASLKPSLRIQPVDDRLAQLAGMSLGWYGRHARKRISASVTIDATVVATACLYGRESATSAAMIYTGDRDDLEQLARFELFVGVLLIAP